MRRALPAQHNFNWLRLHGGTLSISLTNRLPVPIGIADNSRASMGVRLLDHTDGSELFRTQLESVVPPGESIDLLTPLAGVEVHRLMDVEVFGESPGSDGRRVWVTVEDGLDIDATFRQVEPDSVVAAVGAQQITLNGTIPAHLRGDLGIVGGTVLTGRIPLHFTNQIPLTAHGTVRFPELLEEGEPISLTVDLPAGTPGTPGTFDTVIELAGRTVRSPDEQPLDELSYVLQVTTEASRGVVALGRRQEVRGTLAAAPIEFAEVDARPQEVAIDVPVTRTAIDLPEEVRDFDLVQGSLELALENAVGVPGRADVVLRGIGGTEPIEIPVELSIAAGSVSDPVVSTTEITESTSPLLDLIRARPRTLEIEGSVFVGTDGQLVSIRQSDWITGHYEVGAPLRLRVGHLEHGIDDFDFNISDDAQTRIREDVVRSRPRAASRTDSRSPPGCTSSSPPVRTVWTSPEIQLDPLVIDAGIVDAVSGRVTQSTEEAFSIPLRDEDIPFFARDRVFGRFSLELMGDSTAVVELTSTDFIELSSILEFRVGVGTEPSR
ncbi:MAG: hypothetical protein R3E12_05365 [Candidatus Eisenbacteria bacterium]